MDPTLSTLRHAQGKAERAGHPAAVEVYEADAQLKSKLILPMLPSFGIQA
jgi:hypothetical protein